MQDLRHDKMMDHLLNALERGEDIGHYGRLVFIMGARHALDSHELVEWLAKDKDCSSEKAKSLVEQVEQRNYNPPRRERIIEWMDRQGFPICPDKEDPDACNLYKSMQFPHEVYEHIGKYQDQKSSE